jgi:hypothetical protein
MPVGVRHRRQPSAAAAGSTHAWHPTTPRAAQRLRVYLGVSERLDGSGRRGDGWGRGGTRSVRPSGSSGLRWRGRTGTTGWSARRRRLWRSPDQGAGTATSRSASR